MNDTLTRLDRYIRARYPLIALISHEETRVMTSLRSLAAQRGRWLYAWTITQGLVAPFPELAGQEFESTQEPVAALDALRSYPEDAQPTIFVFKDLHPYLREPVIVRSLRDVSARFELSRHTLVMLSPDLAIPPELEKTAVVLDWPLPDETELAGILSQCERDLPERIPVTLNGNRQNVIQAMRGLTVFEASSVLLSAVAATSELSEEIIPHIVSEKKQIVRKSGVLEFFEADVTMDHVGGLPYLKRYAALKRSTFTEEARTDGVEPARGVLLLGLPGTGKSLTAKAIAGGQMPLLRMDVGALMNSALGGSEANARLAFKVAEAIAPCVLWIDEIEKALGSQGGEHDGGTTMRVLGSILTFMQETKAPIYFVATANDVRSLRPELIGRFDDVIFCDLPNHRDRVEILSVHLRKRRRDPQDFDLQAVAAACWGCVGREIERLVKNSLETAHFAGEQLTTAHLLAAAARIIPLSATLEVQIGDLRAWAKSRAMLASDPIEPRPTPTAQSRTLDLS